VFKLWQGQSCIDGKMLQKIHKSSMLDKFVSSIEDKEKNYTDFKGEKYV